MEQDERTNFGSKKQRELFAGKAADLANIAVGSLVFGYVTNADVLNEFTLFVGVLIAVTAYGYALKLSK